MSDDETYNGWVNRETWACHLHLSNDHGLYNDVNALADEARKDAPSEYAELIDAGILMPERAVIRSLSDKIKDYWEQLEHYEDEFGDPMPKDLADMLIDVGSSYRIEWDEIAENWLAE